MAAKKVGKITVPIELSFDDSELKEKIKKNKDLIQSELGNNTLIYNLEIDKNGKKAFADTIKEIKSSGKNVLVNIDDKEFLKQLKTMKIKSKTEFEDLRKYLLNVFDFSSSKTDVDNSLKPIMTQLTKIQSQAEKIVSLREELFNVNKEIASATKNQKKENLYSAYDKVAKYEDNDKQTKKLEKSKIELTAAYNDYLKSIGGEEAFFNDDTLSRAELNVRKRMKRHVDSATKDYSLSAESIEKYVKDLEVKVNSAIESLLDKKNTIIEEAKKIQSTNEIINIGQSSNSTSKNSDIQNSDKVIGVNIKPLNVDEFYGEIEKYKVADININISNKDEIANVLKDQTVDVKVNPIFDRDNSVGDADKIKKELTNIIAKGSKTSFTNEDFYKIKTLHDEYLNIKQGSPPILGSIVKKQGLNSIEFIEALNKAKSSFAEIKKNMSNNNLFDKPIEIPISFKVDESEINEIIDKVSNEFQNISLNFENSDKDASIFNNIENELDEIIRLQEIVKSGNREILSKKTSSNTISNQFIDKKDVRGGFTTKKSIERVINEYNTEEASKDVLTNKLSAYVSAYKKPIEAVEVFGSKNQQLWDDVSARIENAYKAQQAYNELLSKSGALIDKYKNRSITSNGDELKDGFISSLTGGKEEALQYLEKELNISNNKNKSLVSGFDEVIPISVVYEEKNFDDVILDIDKIKSFSPINIDLNIEAINSDKMSNVKEDVVSIKELKENVLSLKPTFNKASEDILEASIKQMSSIDTVTSSVKKLKEEMSAVGVTSFVDIQKDAKKIESKIKEKKENLAKDVMLDMKKSIISASEKNNGFIVNPNSIKIQSNGIITLSGIVEDLGDTYTVAKVKINDFKKAINNDGSFNLDYINSNISEMHDVVRKIDPNIIKTQFKDALDLSNMSLNEDSLKVNAKGVISFTKQVKNTTGELKNVKYIIDDISSVLNKNGSINLRLLENFRQKNEKSKMDMIKEAVDSTSWLKDVDTTSFKLEKDSGIVSFYTKTKDVNGELKKTRYIINDIYSVLNKSGSLNKNKLNKTIFEEIDLTEIKEAKDSYIKALKEYKQLNANIRSGNIDVNNREDFVKKTSDLEFDIKKRKKILNDYLQSEKLTLKERNEIYKLFELENQKIDENLFSESKLKNFDSSLKSLSKFDTNDLKNIKVDDGGQILSLREKFKNLKTEAELTYNKLSSGMYSSKTEANELSIELNQQITALNNLKKASNLANNKQGRFVGNIDLKNNKIKNISNDELQDKVMSLIANRYGKNKKYDNVKFIPDKNQLKFDMIDGKRITQLTANLRQYQNALKETAIEVRTLDGVEKEYRTAGEKWVDGVKSKFHSLTQYMTGIEVVLKGIQELKEGFNFVKELNRSMTTVYQTMDITKEGLKDLSSGAIDQARELGSTSDQVIDAIGIYAAYGETVDSILSKTKPTTMLANATGSSAEEASSQIQGVLQQFKELEGQEMRIVNSYEKIAANIQLDFPKGIQAISEGTSVAGNVAETAGLKFEEYAASIAKVAEVTRMEGSAIGNAYKTILSRVSRSKESDPDTTLEDRGQAAKALSSIGISVYNEDGVYQDFSTTLDMLSEKWQNLTDAQRANIAESMAGVRNINVMQTIIDTWGEAKELSNSALKDSNYAMSVQEKHMESINAKTNALRSSIQDFWNSLLDTEIVSFAVDSGTLLVRTAELFVTGLYKIGDVLPVVNGGLVSIAGTLATIYAGYRVYENTKDTGGILSGILETKKGFLNVAKSSSKNISSIFKPFVDGFTKGLTRGLSKDDSTKGIFSAFFRGITSGAKGATHSLTLLQKGILGFSSTAIAITAAVVAFDKLTVSSEEASESAKKAFKDYSEEEKKLNSKKSFIDKNSAEFERLSEGVKINGSTVENISLTTEEFEKYNNISKEIANQFPTLLYGYNAQGNAILNLKNGVKSLNEEYEKQLKILQQRNIDENAEKYIDDYNNKTGNRGSLTAFTDTIGDVFGTAIGDEYEIGKAIDKGRGLEILKELQSKSLEQLNDSFEKLEITPMEESMLNSLGLENISKMTEDEWNKVKNTISVKVSELESDLAVSEVNMKSIMTSYLNVLTLNGGVYDNLDEKLFGNISKLLSGLKGDSLKEIIGDSSGDEALSKLKEYVLNIVSKLKEDPNAQIKLDNILNVDEDTSLEKLESIITNDLSVLSEKLGKDKSKLSIQLGLEGKEEVVKRYKEVIGEITTDLDSQARNELNKMFSDIESVGGKLETIRRPADVKELNKLGWETDGKNSSLSAKVVDTKNSSLVVTPVLPDGSIMTPKEFDNYINNVIKKGKKDDKNIKIASFDKKDTKNGKNARKEAEKLTNELRESDKYANYLGDNTKLINDFLNDNNVVTTEQLELLKQCYDETNNWYEATSRFSSKSVDISANEDRLKSLKENLKTVKSNVESVDKAIQSTNSTLGMSSEEIENLSKIYGNIEGYNYDKLFESTSEGVKANSQELERLNDLYEKNESKKYKSELENLQLQYTATCKELGEATQGTEEYNQALLRRDGLISQIEKAQELKSMYEGLTNTVTKYFKAKESVEPDRDYLTITQDIKGIKELWNKGETGRDEFKSFVQMFSNKNLETVDDFRKAYGSAMQKATRYFTENGVGAERFLKDIQKATNSQMASVDKNGKWTINADIETISKKLGLTKEIIQEMFNRLKVYDFDVDFEETSDHLKKLREEAEEANKVFSGINDFKIDLGVKDVKDLRNSIGLMEELKEEVKKTFGGNSKEYYSFIKQLDYLKAKLGEISSKEYTVDVHSDKGIKSLQNDLEKLKKIKSIDLKIDFENNDPQVIRKQINDIIKSTKDLRDKDNYIDISVEGGEEATRILAALINKENELNNNSRVILSMDSSNLNSTAKQAIDSLKKVEKAYQEYKLFADMKTNGIKVDTSAFDNAKKELETTAKDFASKNLKASAAIEFDKINYDANSIAEKMKSIDTSVLLKIDGVDDTVFKNYNPNSKVVKFDVDDAKVKGQMNIINSWVATKKILTFGENGLGTIYTSYSRLKDKEIHINYKYSTGVSNTNGTANFYGRSYANGKISADKDANSLVGELGAEMRVRDGKWELIGEHGAEFTNVKKDDIIFNHKQTIELLKNGKIPSRGKAYASGKGDRYTSKGSLSGSNKFYNNYKKSSKKKNSKTDDYKDSFDWIEVAIKRIEEAIERLDIVANSVYKTFSKRNSTLSSEFSKVHEQINLQRRAYNAYLAEANKINISSSYKKKVQNGTMNIETIKGEKNKSLIEKIKEYQSLYDKSIEAKDKILELQETLSDLASQRFDNVISEYDAKLDVIEGRLDKINTGLDIVEAKGQFASKNYYESLINIEQENISMLTSKYNSLNAEFNRVMSTGTIEKYSEKWYEMKQEIDDVSSSILEAQQSLIEYKNEMLEMDWSVFEKSQEYISALSEESEFLIELLRFNESELFDKKTGQFNDKSNAVGGLHAVNYNQYMAQADLYRKKVEEINKEIEADPTNTILLDKKKEYIEAQRESILAANDEKHAIRDLVEESYDKMLEILEELIDKRKEALEAERDLYEYQNSVKDKSKEITDYQKILNSIKGDDSEEAMSKRQEISNQLEQSKKDLDEMMYDKWIDDQNKMLDLLYNEYETVLNERLDNIDGLITEMIESTNVNSEEIGQTIKDTTSNVGYQITDGMNNIWVNTGDGLGKVVLDYSNNFSSTLSTTNNYVAQCVNLLNKIVAKANSESSNNTGGVVKPTTPPSSGGSSSGGSSSSSKPSTTPPSSKPSSSSSNKGSFFVYKRDSYQKSKLKVNTSIVDRLNVRAIMA